MEKTITITCYDQPKLHLNIDKQQRLINDYSIAKPMVYSICNIQFALPCGRTALSITVKGLREYSKINMKYKTIKHTFLS
jgi:hypothetical protein